MRCLMILLTTLFFSKVQAQYPANGPVNPKIRTISINTLQLAIGQFQLNYEQRKANKKVAFTAQLFGGRYNELFVNELLLSRDSLFSVSHLGAAVGLRVYEQQDGQGLFTQISAGYKRLTLDYSRLIVTETFLLLPTQTEYVRYNERRNGWLLEVMGGYRFESKRFVIEPNGGFVVRAMEAQQNLPNALPARRIWILTQANFFSPFLGINLGYRF